MSRGRHGNHAKANRQHRWTEEKIITKGGYVKLRVGLCHPLADPNGYANEHLIIWIAAGNPRPSSNEVLHHANGVKTDNRIENLELIRRDRHSVGHTTGALSNEQVCKIRERYAAGENGTDLALEFGVPHQRVYRFIKGLSRRSAGGPVCEGSLRKKRAGRLLDGREWNEMPGEDA